MKRHPMLGWPIVSIANCFGTVFDLGIRRWTKAKKAVSFDDFRFIKNNSNRNHEITHAL